MMFDVLFGVLLLFGAYHGAKSGFARICLNLTGVVLGVVLAETVVQFATPLLEPHLGAVAVTIRPSVLFLGSVFAVWLCCWILGSMYLRWYRVKIHGENTPSGPDRFLGIGLGLFEAAFVCGVIVWGWEMVPPTVRDAGWVKDQFAASQGVKFAGEYPYAGKLLETTEAQRVKDHLARLLDYFRLKDRPGVEPSFSPDTPALDISLE